MTYPPIEEDIGTSYVAFSWQAWEETKGAGFGPVRAYKVYIRTPVGAGNWNNVGYITNADAKGTTFSFNLTYLNPGTEIEISITAIDLCTGEEGSHGPSLSTMTLGPGKVALDLNNVICIIHQQND